MKVSLILENSYTHFRLYQEINLSLVLHFEMLLIQLYCTKYDALSSIPLATFRKLLESDKSLSGGWRNGQKFLKKFSKFCSSSAREFHQMKLWLENWFVGFSLLQNVAQYSLESDSSELESWRDYGGKWLTAGALAAITSLSKRAIRVMQRRN